MMMSFWYAPEVNYVLIELRRKVIERMVEAKGLTPNTTKFREVVNRYLDKVRHMRVCKYDDEIPARERELARQGRRLPEKITRIHRR